MSRMNIGTRTISARLARALVLWLLATAGAAVPATDALDRSLQIGEENLRHEQHTQQRIEELSDRSRAMLEEYQRLGREHEALVTYNDQLERIVNSQETEKTSLLAQLEDIELTRQEILPLMLRMIDRLERFVAEDSPFLEQERTRRVARLRELLDRADVSVAEKYRRVLEAYQVELDYGRTLEAYRDELDLAGERRTVDILRVGRVGLYYQSLDGRHSGYWDTVTRSWQSLDGRDRLAIRQGLRVARQEVAPELLRLPVAAAESERP
jgi:hypothetical protein